LRCRFARSVSSIDLVAAQTVRLCISFFAFINWIKDTHFIPNQEDDGKHEAYLTSGLHFAKHEQKREIKAL